MTFLSRVSVPVFFSILLPLAAAAQTAAVDLKDIEGIGKYIFAERILKVYPYNVKIDPHWWPSLLCATRARWRDSFARADTGEDAKSCTPVISFRIP
jgi:hypothetical protein